MNRRYLKRIISTGVRLVRPSTFMALSRYAVRGASVRRLDPALERWFVRQMDRARHAAAQGAKRYVQRCVEADDLRRRERGESDTTIKNRGLAQPCNLDTRRTNRGMGEEFDW